MMFDFNELYSAVEGEVWDEEPVDIWTFVTSPDYLNEPPPSDHQLNLMKASTQILKKETLIAMLGEKEGLKRWKQTVNEVIANIGKGGGKDWSSEISCAYVVYQLLCLKDPAKYYGKPSGDFIDIINIAINAQQANNVFFAGFKRIIKKSKWFQGKYDVKAGEIHFDKNVRVISGHSERESYEGYNFLYVTLDEIAGFAVDNASGNEKAKTAEAVYNMYSASVSSRFSDVGKVILLSFSRYKGDFISTRYNEVIAEKEVVKQSYTFKLDPDLPDGMEDNEFTIEWDEDYIIRYTEPRVWALRRPTWDVNPTKHITDFTRDFFRNPSDAIGRFASQPPESIEGYFRNHEQVERALCRQNGVLEDGSFADWFKPEDKEYFIHVDLAKKHDNCVVSMAHVDKWERHNFGSGLTEPVPTVIVDCIRVWSPTKDKMVDFTEVREFIVSLRSRGFNLRRVTFDRWQSQDLIEYFNNIGLKSDILSVALPHYNDVKMVMMENRLFIPKIGLLGTEFKQLKIMPNGKLDHPRSGSKDIADSVTGAVFNAIKHTHYAGGEIEIKTASDFRRELTQREEAVTVGPIKAPSRQAPASIEDFLRSMRTL